MKDVFLRRAERGRYVIPILLRDTRSQAVIKAVVLDLSAKGLRCLTNDRRLLLPPERPGEWIEHVIEAIDRRSGPSTLRRARGGSVSGRPPRTRE